MENENSGELKFWNSKVTSTSISIGKPTRQLFKVEKRPKVYSLPLPTTTMQAMIPRNCQIFPTNKF